MVDLLSTGSKQDFCVTLGFLVTSHKETFSPHCSVLLDCQLWEESLGVQTSPSSDWWRPLSSEELQSSRNVLVVFSSSVPPSSQLLVSPLRALAVRPPTDRRESWPIMSNVRGWQHCTKMGACLMLAVLPSHLGVQPYALEMFSPYPTMHLPVPQSELMAAFCPQHDVSVWHGSEQKCHLSYRKTTPPAGWQFPRVSEPSQAWPPHYLCIQWPVFGYVYLMVHSWSGQRLLTQMKAKGKHLHCFWGEKNTTKYFSQTQV